MKIAVYAIAKDEEKFVERFCESAKGADMILIADTGSTDRTKELAIKHGATVVDICISPWRFDKARDAALALLPADVDVCVSRDLDEVLTEGWREEIERVWTDDTTRLRYKFRYSEGYEYFCEKIHARHGYHWHHPCHEYPRPDTRIQEVYATTDMVLAEHKPDMTKSRGYYLPLLKVAVTEDPHCSRNSFYYARELYFRGKWDEAIQEFQRYLTIPQAVWNVERSYAMRVIGLCHKNLGQRQEAEEALLRAATGDPQAREPLVELAQLAYESEHWTSCYKFASDALKITDRQNVFTMDPTVWGYRPHDLLALAAFYTERYDEARKHGQIALELAPDDARLKSNMEFYAPKAA